jgi:hypothetical protein
MHVGAVGPAAVFHRMGWKPGRGEAQRGDVVGENLASTARNPSCSARWARAGRALADSLRLYSGWILVGELKPSQGWCG